MRDSPGDELDTPGLRRIARSIEERLAELAVAGELSGLPGEGRPLAEDGGALAGDRWAAHHILANERVLPAWIELGREIEAQRERLARSVAAHREWLAARAALRETFAAERILDEERATAAADDRFRRALGREIDALNAQIARFNAVVPVVALQRLPLDPAMLGL